MGVCMLAKPAVLDFPMSKASNAGKWVPIRIVYYNTSVGLPLKLQKLYCFVQLPFIIVGSALLPPAAHGRIYIHHGNALMQSSLLALTDLILECLRHPPSCAWLDMYI